MCLFFLPQVYSTARPGVAAKYAAIAHYNVHE